jgi:hypothetical protein
MLGLLVKGVLWLVEELSQMLLLALGTVAILGSIAAFILVYNSDTAVEYAPGQYVNNIGLMEQRHDRMLLCGIFAALGFALVIAGNKSSKPRKSAEPGLGDRAPRLDWVAALIAALGLLALLAVAGRVAFLLFR